MRSSTPPAAVRVGGLALAGIVLVGAGMIYLGGGDASSETRVEPASAKRGTVVSGVAAAGNTVDAHTRDLAFGASGTVEKVYVKVGQKVRKGQVLTRVDDTIAREEYTAAKASLAAAEETLDKLESGESAGTGTSSGSGRTPQGTTPTTTRPSGRPSAQPSGNETPSGDPTTEPSGRPSPQPSGNATSSPSGEPSGRPSARTSGTPSAQPSSQTSCPPSASPSASASWDPVSPAPTVTEPTDDAPSGLE